MSDLDLFDLLKEGKVYEYFVLYVSTVGYCSVQKYVKARLTLDFKIKKLSIEKKMMNTKSMRHFER